jgi:N-acetylmuramic acid 6-phosphate etherase
MLTESQNTRTSNIDQLSTLDMLMRINDEDAKVAAVVRDALPQIAQAVDGIAERMGRGGRLIYTGAGTSGRLGVLDADLVALDLSPDDAVVGIAASGRTPYVLGGLAYARKVGAFTVGISCNMPAPVLDAAQIAIGLPVGPEVITGSTRMKAGTAQKLVLNMISTATMVTLGKVYGNLMVDVRPTNVKLVDRARRIITQIAQVDYDEAARLLDAAGDEVKTAIVMARRGISADEARALLAATGGRLRPVID